ncbi:ent-kaurene oxidase [Pyricularia oryzae]|nr:ent-kaurene oxidase [Pyricularia oryzae]
MANETFSAISQPGAFPGLGAQTSAWASYVVAALLLASLAYSRRDKYRGVPDVTPSRPFELTDSRKRKEFLAKSREILAQGSKRYGDQPYKVTAEMGQILVLPPQYVAELKNNPALDLTAFVQKILVHAYLPGFEPFGAAEATVKIIPKYVNKKLGKSKSPIRLLCLLEQKQILTLIRKIYRWTEIDAFSILRLASRMSSRIFMGKDICKDPVWFKALLDYISDIGAQRNIISGWPLSLRPIIYRLVPASFRIKRKLQKCRDVLKPHLERRAAIIKDALARGEPNPFDDSIQWYENEVGDGEKDHAVFQIGIFLVAIPNTADTLMQTLHHLALNPEYISVMREEVIRVIGTHGLNKAALQKLDFMDSCLKESDVTMSNGFTIKKGTVLGMDGTRMMMDEDIYPEPERYNPRRFMEMRKLPSGASKAPMVTVTPDHHAFGHGIHSCPGRFFVTTALKIALAHMVLKYDWKVAEGYEDAKPRVMGMRYLASNVKLQVRRRKEELDLDSLAAQTK